MFRRTTGTTETSGITAVASALLTLAVPLGIQTQPILQVALSAAASESTTILFGSAAAGSANCVVAEVATGAGDSLDAVQCVVPPVFVTNTSAQLYFCNTDTGGAVGYTISSYGWIDTRGRLA